ncbi:MAG: hypothetical protein ACREFF_07780 [Candidatus Udaeobacter sp.]
MPDETRWFTSAGPNQYRWSETPDESHDDAVSIGTNGGLAKSYEKTIAARANGLLGGWWSWHGDRPPQPPP